MHRRDSIALLRTTAVVVVCAADVAAQPPPGLEARVDSIASTYVRLARQHQAAIWPGFRADSIPVALVFAQGTFLFNWSGALPAGFQPSPVAGSGWRDSASASAASTGIRIDGRGVAQVVVRDMDPAEIIATALHEAFHVFQGASRREGQRFGTGENSFHVATYPVFDATHEALFALEGRILADALTARSRVSRLDLARQFVATRRERLRRLATEFAEFDRASEMNEGLAEYVLVRALDLLAADPEVPAAWRAAASRKLEALPEQLRNLTADSGLSFRLRYYHTGPAIARLLDALRPDWKARFVGDNLWLEDVLADATGIDDAHRAAFRSAVARFDSAATARQAAANIASLQQRRRRQVDSIMGAPGIVLVVRADSLPTRNFNLCGLDPQNLLQVTERIRLQTRWWRPCSGGPTYVDLNVPSVHDAEHGTLTAVIGGDDQVTVTAGGVAVPLPQPGETLRDLGTFKLSAPGVTVEAARADVTRSGRTLTVWPKRAP